MEIPQAMTAKSTTRPELDNHSQWLGYMAGVKFDGVRCLMKVYEDGPKFFSRAGNEFTEQVPHLVELFSELPVGTQLDGELALVTGSVEIVGKQVPLVDFNKTMRIIGSLPEKAIRRQEEFGLLTYLVFDLLAHGEHDWHDEPQKVRTALTQRIVSELDSQYLISETLYYLPNEYGLVYDELVALKQEGLMLKRLESKYVEGKRLNKAWYKVKDVMDADVVVSGFTEGTGKFAGLIGAIEFSAFDPDGKLIYVGRCSGITDLLRRDISAHKDQYLGMVMVVRYNELVGSKLYRTPRHPQFSNFRDDKPASECLMEQFKVEE
jgi:ATP-dependent DNA ligase